ncbi:MAG: hypothetical protein M1828_003966 [Chrysothrix sp. TS-e1954]|nr:MAG: hypothetical protein M1828_003966 [Chrysothrix sp. TS-e1954]
MASQTSENAMKAWQYTSIVDGDIAKSLTLNEQAVRPPTTLASDQLAVEVITTSLNPVDYKLAEIPLVGSLLFKKPATPSSDYSGRVTAVGSGISDLKVGDLCYGRLEKNAQFGALGQNVVAPKEGAVPLPSGVHPDSAACIGCAGLTAYQCIASNVNAGDEVFIHGGSGGTGTFGIQIAKRLGCKVTTCCSTRNMDLCKELGADEVIDYTQVSVAQTLAEKGPRFLLCVDNVGSPAELYTRSHEFLLPKGKFVQVGAQIGMSTVASLMSRMMLPTILGGGKRSYQFLGCTPNREQYATIGEWMREGSVKAIIDEKFKFEDASKAFEKLKTGRARGKIVVQVAAA